MAFGSKATVSSIIAPVSKVIKQLEDHKANKIAEAEAHQTAMEELLKKKEGCIAEHSQAGAIAAKLKEFFNL